MARLLQRANAGDINFICDKLSHTHTLSPTSAYKHTY